MCAKVVGGGFQEGGGFPIAFFIFERGWLKRNSVKVYRGWLTRRGLLTRANTLQASAGGTYPGEYGNLPGKRLCENIKFRANKLPFHKAALAMEIKVLDTHLTFIFN